MKWLTISQIKRRSYTAKGALKVSYEHWNQLYMATAKELRTEIEEVGSELYYTLYCGLCSYYNDCDKCVFFEFCVDGEALWDKAKNALEEWREGKGNWRDRKRACKAVRDKLKKLMEQGT